MSKRDYIVPKFLAKSSDKELIALIHKHYKDSLLDFLRDCTTEDAHDQKNPFKPLPVDKVDYIKTIANTYLNYNKIVIVKSRQVMVSWIICCIILWNVLFFSGVRVAVVSKKSDDARKLIERIEFVYSKLGAWKPNLEFVYHPLPKVSCGENRSFIYAMPQGAEQLRGDTFTIVFSDEFAFQDEQERTWTSSRPTVDGGGKFIAVSTPNGRANLFYRLAQDPSFNRIDIHWSQNPYKDEKWQKEAFSSISESARQQEYELNFLAAQTDRIYEDFNYVRMVKPLQISEYHPLLVGWDFGYKRPAVVYAQLFNESLYWLKSHLGQKETITDFAHRILQMQKVWFPHFQGQIFDYCDPAGKQVNDQTGETDIEALNKVLKDFGRQLAFVESKDLEIGHNLIRRFMRTQIKGESGFYIDPSNTNGIEGLAGGYHYHGLHEKVCGCAIIDTGEKELEYYKHIQDCTRYIVLNNYADHGKPMAYKTSAIDKRPKVDQRFIGQLMKEGF